MVEWFTVLEAPMAELLDSALFKLFVAVAGVMGALTYFNDLRTDRRAEIMAQIASPTYRETLTHSLDCPTREAYLMCLDGLLAWVQGHFGASWSKRAALKMVLVSFIYISLSVVFGWLFGKITAVATLEIFHCRSALFDRVIIVLTFTTFMISSYFGINLFRWSIASRLVKLEFEETRFSSKRQAREGEK